MQSQLQLLESADSRNAMDIFSTDQTQLILLFEMKELQSFSFFLFP